jgi:hypothetical protein
MLPNDPIYYRLAEIGLKWKNGTSPDSTDMYNLRECLIKHATIMEDVVLLNNMSMAAHLVNDYDWQHRIIAASEEFAQTSHLEISWLTQYDERKIHPWSNESQPPTGTKDDEAEGAD